MANNDAINEQQLPSPQAHYDINPRRFIATSSKLQTASRSPAALAARQLGKHRQNFTRFSAKPFARQLPLWHSNASQTPSELLPGLSENPCPAQQPRCPSKVLRLTGKILPPLERFPAVIRTEHRARHPCTIVTSRFFANRNRMCISEKPIKQCRFSLRFFGGHGVTEHYNELVTEHLISYGTL